MADTRRTARQQLVAAEGASKLRQSLILRRARDTGLIGDGKDARITGRVSRRLLQAAKARIATASDTELIEYALARVALEDDFADKIAKRIGTVPRDIDLEF